MKRLGVKTIVDATVADVGGRDPLLLRDLSEKSGVRAAKEAGVSIITHTEGATVGPVQQELFLRLGADPERVMIGHQNNSEDIGYALSQLEKPGFYLGLDRVNPLMSMASEDNIVNLVARGYGDRIMISHDCIFMWLGRPGKLPPQYADWYPDYIFRKLFPKMKEAGVTEKQIQCLLVDNPARFFGGAQKPPE